MQVDTSFFSACLSAGAILTGFCGTFLSFRIQREANYCRQPAVDFQAREGRDIYLGLSHFTSSFLLLILSTLFAIIFGFVLPLFALCGQDIPKSLVVVGLVNALIFLCAYFLCEMVHYGILTRRLLNDANEWGRSRKLVAATCAIALLCSAVIGFYL